MVYRGYNYKNTDSVQLYDRVLGRFLHFDFLNSVPGVVDATKYGQPVPYYHFVQLGQGKNPLVQSMDRSEWAYVTQKPASSSDVGVKAPMPIEDSLPKYSTAPKVPHFNLQVDNESDDGLSPCLENP